MEIVERVFDAFSVTDLSLYQDVLITVLRVWTTVYPLIRHQPMVQTCLSREALMRQRLHLIR